MIDSVLMTGNTFADWLERKYLEWQIENGRASLRKFSKWLGINHGQLNTFINGKEKPGPMTLPKLAARLGYEVYDVLELPRPDERLEELIRDYKSIPPERRAEYSQALREFVHTWASRHGWELVQDDITPDDNQDIPPGPDPG